MFSVKNSCQFQRIADLREKAIMDEKAIYAKGLDDGKKELEERLQELRENTNGMFRKLWRNNRKC